jgi:putative Mg2+ transporter-C (MgtC) family protein
VIPDSLHTATPEALIALRMALALVFGAGIGFEREVKDRPAGLRTHMMISLAAAVFAIITIEIFEATKLAVRGPGTTPADPIRIVEAVTAGVAFLAAGVIIQSRGRVQGLTTGAGMWLAGAIGVACGLGYYSIALMGTILALMILRLVALLERYWLGTKPKKAAPEEADRG